jgi:hypothetical protein
MLEETRHASIVYECGEREGTVDPETYHRNDKVACDVRTGEYNAGDFSGYARRHANFSGDFTNMDLAGVVEVLSSALAIYGNTNSLVPTDLTGNAHIVVTAIGNASAPISAGKGRVFVPNCIDSPTSMDTFAAIVYAVAGAGGQVITDYVYLDTANNVRLPDITGIDLAYACYHALRIIGGNYDQARAGDVFAYAMTRGIHSRVTVVGHTDEAGYMRRVLRCGSFAAPYGGINVRDRGYVGLPKPNGDGRWNFTQLVDEIALVTAAAVSVSDPLVEVDGQMFPSIFTARSKGGMTERGQSLANTQAKLNAMRISDGCSEFAQLYVRNLGCIFGFDRIGVGVNTNVAVKHLRTMFSVVAHDVDRHLAYPSVAPFFWVEPTSLITKSMLIEESQGMYGPLAYPELPCEHPLAENARELGDTSMVSAITYNHRSARTSGLMIYLNGHKSDGLANIQLRQADPASFAHIGGTTGDVREKMNANKTYDTYVWRRGQSPFPAPSEMLYTGHRVGVIVKQYAMLDDFSVEPTHVPLAREIMTGVVHITVTRPQVVANGASNWASSQAVHDRTEASRAIDIARMKYGGLPDVRGYMPLAFGFVREDVQMRKEESRPAQASGGVPIFGDRAALPGTVGGGVRESMAMQKQDLPMPMNDPMNFGVPNVGIVSPGGSVPVPQHSGGAEAVRGEMSGGKAEQNILSQFSAGPRYKAGDISDVVQTHVEPSTHREP